MEKQEVKEIEQKRPFLLSILCTAVFVYSVFFAILFIAGLIFREWVTNLLNDYLLNRQYDTNSVILFSLSGIFLYGLSFASALLMWRLNRIGLFLYIFTTLLLVIIPYFIGFGNLINVAVFSILIILFSAFYRRFK